MDDQAFLRRMVASGLAKVTDGDGRELSPERVAAILAEDEALQVKGEGKTEPPMAPVVLDAGLQKVRGWTSVRSEGKETAQMMKLYC